MIEQTRLATEKPNSKTQNWAVGLLMTQFDLPTSTKSKTLTLLKEPLQCSIKVTEQLININYLGL